MSGDQLDFHQGNKETLTGTLHDPAATTGHVLTVQADKSIAAAPGGGGGSGVQVVTVPVSSAQILDLFNTPVVLIPGVAGNMTIPTAVNIVYVAGLIPYLDGGGDLHIATRSLSNPTTNICNWTSAAPTAGVWDQAVSQQLLYSFTTPDNACNPVAEFAAQGIVLFQDTANPTLGDGTLLVTLSYFLAPTV